MRKQINHIVCENSIGKGYGISRKCFSCLEINIPTNGEWLKNVMAIAEKIEKKLNAGQANSSEQRDEKTIKIDNLSGVIAEYACHTVLQEYLGKVCVEKPSSETSKNQIDILLSKGRKTIEVRSSCVKNGINFALFAKPNTSREQQYFDIIGPYTNDYKPGEEIKDYYMRVFYSCEKKHFLELLEAKELRLYITGGATGAMMSDKSVYQIKHMIPSGGEVERESDYRVIPLGKSLDIDEFIDAIKSENS